MKKAASALLLALAVLTGCSRGTQAVKPTPDTAPTRPPAAASTPAPTPTPTPDPVEALLAGMTVEEKVGQLFIAGFEGTAVGEDVTTLIQQNHVGGIIFFNRNVESAEQLSGAVNTLKSLNRGPVPLFMSVDQEGGMVNRMPSEVHKLPNAYNQSGSAMGRAVAAQCLAFGFNVDFAPVLDVWSNPKNTVIGKRAFGSDWKSVSVEGPEAAYAMMDAGVIPVVKHFPGHGDTDVDSHVGLPVVTKSLEELREAELVPFELAIQGSTQMGFVTAAPVPAVMVSHIVLKALDPDRPATLSPAVVNGLLREELGFEGVVFTDDMTMGAITENYGLGEACVMAVEAGCDVLLVCHGQENILNSYSAVLEAVNSGRLSQERLDESVRRILGLKLEYGLSDATTKFPDLDYLNAIIDKVASAKS